MKYVDIILPLPLNRLFTYSVPSDLQPLVQPGMRVLVPFGTTKTRVGLIAHAHDEKPDFSLKDIKLLLDEAPLVTGAQLKLWQWIADYYLAAIGDVYTAALPGGLKSTDSYTPKTEVYVGLAPTYRSEQALHIALDILRRSDAQRKVFVEYLHLSHWDMLQGDTPTEKIAEVSREELLNVTRSTTPVFRNLVVRQLLTTYQREVGRLNDAGEAHLERIKPLSEAQQTAFDSVQEQFKSKSVVLLHGVTSSGKTEIYIHLIQQALAQGQQVLYLLPEIALTVQMRHRLQQVFGNRLGIYHSKYADAERVEIWKKQLSAQPYDVILGARSAVLLPFTRLGLVIVDEEHETSFKQQDPAPRYHARNVAIMLAHQQHAKVLLGSATPSIESLYNADIGKYGLVRLTRRYSDMQLPAIHVVDTKDLQHRKMMSGPFSPTLLQAVRQALDRDEQVILFQNRRGFAPMIECRECGWVPHCEQCDVSLTYHKRLNQLTCHYCGAAYPVPMVCPCCGSHDLRGRGYGTEKIEDQVSSLFPDARIARMDLDTTHTRNAYERIINDFSAHRTNLLIGTQMVTKGLDFDKVSVVGILNADSMLNYPDFRAYEYAFSMLSQVGGRAGRKGHQGLVILQTKSPQLPIIAQVVHNDSDTFFKDQLEEREAFHYPPFCHLVYAYLRHKDDVVVEQAATDFAAQLRRWLGPRVLGPDKPSIAKVKTLHIRKLVIKLERGISLPTVRQHLRTVQEVMMKDKRYGGVQIYYDVDPC